MLVLGAGASYPYGFPLGFELLTKIRDRCQQIAAEGDLGNDDIRDEFSRSTGRGDEYIVRPTNGEESLRISFDDFGALAKAIDISKPLSIDSFLNSNRNASFAFIARLIIADELLKAEYALGVNGRVREEVDHGMNVENDDWLVPLMDRLTSRLPFESLSLNQLSIVTFNYDRSFEYLLTIRLAARYGVSRDEAETYVNTLPIHHVYGSLGKFSLEAMADLHSRRSEDLRHILDSHDRRLNAARSIRLMYDDRDKDDKHLKELVRHAQHIMFLGFGFDDMNLRTIGIPGTPHCDHTVYLASKGLHGNRQLSFKRNFRASMAHPTDLKGPFSVDGDSRKALEESAFLP